MRSESVVYAWEQFPEYVAVQQYSRCLGRILVSLPARVRRLAMKPLIHAATVMGMAIAGAHAEPLPDGGPSDGERQEFREIGLDCVGATRECLKILKDNGLGRPADMAAASELLERVEDGLRHRPLPGTVH